MRKVIYWVNTSVDGFVEGPHGEFDWALVGPELDQYSRDVHEHVDTLLYGRRVFEMMAGYWPTAGAASDDPHDQWFLPVWNSTPKIVFSRSQRSIEWADEVVGGDLAAAIERLRSAPGRDLLLTGGAELAARLSELDLIDEYRIAVHPVVLAGGRQVLPLTERRTLTLVDATVLDERVTVMRYTR